MKTGILITVILMIIVIGAGIYLVLNMNNQANTNNNEGGTSNPGNIGAAETKNAEIKNFAFSPSTITINKGDMIRWTNIDSVSHTITSDSGSELDSNIILRGQSYSHTFNKVGTYNYHCTLHQNMKGTIIVQ